MPERLEDLQLTWPRPLFLRELRDAQVVPTSVDDGWDPSRAPAVGDFDLEKTDLLFHEAFHSSSGTEWLLQVRRDGTDGALLRSILADPDRVPEYAPPRLYRDRKSGPGSRPELAKLSRSKFGDAIEELLGELDGAGSFDNAFGSSCVDSQVNHRGRGSRMLSELMGSDEPWPPQLLFSTDDHLFTTIEAAYHFVARPRRARWHQRGQEWDYSDFDTSAGQAVYRWRVNVLLERYGTSLRLDPIGVLVETTNDPRDELIQELAQAPTAPNRDSLRHAIGLFRHRGATREDKRSAVVSLVGILEEHRGLLDQNLLSKDEGALFEIANRFAIRHQRADQRPDYDDAYLEWLFWWYLATVDLVNRLLKRGDAQAE